MCNVTRFYVTKLPLGVSAGVAVSAALFVIYTHTKTDRNKVV